MLGTNGTKTKESFRTIDFRRLCFLPLLFSARLEIALGVFVEQAILVCSSAAIKTFPTDRVLRR